MRNLVELSVIIVNWNTLENLIDLISSLKHHGGDTSLEIVVVDNCSGDGSIDYLSAAEQSEIVTIANSENRGFGAACNQGVSAASGRYLLFLNPDTRVNSSSISPVLDFYKAAEEVDILGIKLTSSTGELDRNCSRFPTATNLWLKVLKLDKFAPLSSLSINMYDFDHENDRYVDQLIGAYMMMSKELFLDVGGFDERFFMYFEEVDFAYRAHKKGFKSFYSSEHCAMHIGGGASSKVVDRRLYYSLKSRLQFAAKHFSKTGYLATAMLTFFVEPFVRFLHIVMNSKADKLDSISNTARSYLMLLKDRFGIR